MNKKKIAVFTFALLIIYVLFNYLIVGNNVKVLGELKNLIPENQKVKIKKYLFPYKYITELENNLKLTKDEVNSRIEFSKEMRLQLSERDEFLSELFEKRGFVSFNESTNNIIKFDTHAYNLKEFNQDFLKIKKHGDAKSGSIYIEKVNDNIIMLTANGKFQYFNKADLNNKKFNGTLIKSNIRELINYEDFYKNSNYGVKDLFFFNEYLYFSFNREVTKGCFNTSILRAKINYEKLKFENFFSPDDCQLKSREGFTPHSAGGRMAKFNGKIIFSNGEYLNRMLAQDDKSIFGKILMLDPLNPQKYQMISKGHRNVQGLFVDEEESLIVSTEHGPMGGDEVNLNNKLGEEVLNFGWPISSYGEHYGFKKRIDSHKAYKNAPLYKSHSKYGFIEPVKYFVPSIGISEIVKFKKTKDKNFFLFGALGKDPSEGDMSLHLISMDKDYNNLIDHEIVNIKSRIRDIINLENGNFLLSLETSSTLGFLEKLN